MAKQIKIGDKVMLIKDIKQQTICGDEFFLKETTGIVCDDDNPNCPIVELTNSDGKLTFTGFWADDLKIIK